MLNSGKKILNETKNHNPPLQVKWSVPKEFNIRLYDKNSESYFFFLTSPPPPQVKWSFLKRPHITKTWQRPCRPAWTLVSYKSYRNTYQISPYLSLVEKVNRYTPTCSCQYSYNLMLTSN